MKPVPSFLMLTAFYIHHERLNEIKLQTRVRRIQWFFNSNIWCKILCLSLRPSVCLSVYVSSRFKNWLTTFFRFVDSVDCSSSAIQSTLCQFFWHSQIKFKFSSCLYRASTWSVTTLTNSRTHYAKFMHVKITLKIHIKSHIKTTPTCFGTQRNHPQGASICA